MCATWLSQCIQELGRAAQWNCLKQRVMLSEDPTYNPTPPVPAVPLAGPFPGWWSGSPGSQQCKGLLYEWKHRYQLPGTFLKAIELNGNDCWGNHNGDLFEIYGRFLYCNRHQADLKFIQYSEDATMFDAMFVTALSHLLAIRIATTLKQDSGALAGQLTQVYMQEILPEALFQNGQERKPRRYDQGSESKFNMSRRGWRNG